VKRGPRRDDGVVEALGAHARRDRWRMTSTRTVAFAALLLALAANASWIQDRDDTATRAAYDATCTALRAHGAATRADRAALLLRQERFEAWVALRLDEVDRDMLPEDVRNVACETVYTTGFDVERWPGAREPMRWREAPALPDFDAVLAMESTR
jgi:hypothetical protein